jgi:hypothetical protein
VRRELKPDSPKIHKLLKHLENKGFSYAPKFLGIDGKGRERLSYIEGEPGNYPFKKIHVAFQKMIDEGHLEHYQNDIKFIREHGKEWI